MTLTSSEKRVANQVRSYERSESVVFLKTKESFGGLSNMAGGFPLRVNGILILTSEALYQACRFPHLPDVQRLIIGERSPMTAKMKSKPHRRDSRPDWDHVRVRIMRWCLRVKLAQNWRSFSELLLETGERPIVEESRKDGFWGAKPVDDRTLVGVNVLGRLLMELREAVKAEGRDVLLRVEPIAIPDFLLGGRPIETVFAPDSKVTATTLQPVEYPPRGNAGSRESTQTTFFDTPVVKEGVPPAYLDVSAKVVRIVDLKPYPEYKESGLAWLGQVPRCWEVKRAKSIFQRIDKRSRTGKEELLTVSSTRGIVPRKTANVTMFKAESYLGYKLCWPGDLVINSLWAWAGGLGVSRHHGIISSAYGVYRIRPDAPMTPAFVHQVVRSASFNWELRVRSKGVWISRLQLTDISFLDAPMHIPPPPEQAAVVRFLDWANGRLDRAIRAKRKVIALLNEQKQAIIHRAVTLGLDPSVPLKPSGIPWLGDIPHHWEVVPFVRCTVERADYRGATPEKVDSGIFLATAKNIRKGWIDYECSKEFVRTEDYSKIMRRGLPRIGDVLLTMEAPLGHIALVDREDIAIAQRVVRFRMRAELVRSRFALFALNSPYFQHQLHQRATGSTAQGIKASKLPQLLLVCPPVTEQDEIIERIDVECAPLDNALARIDREIELLREYRTRLVADVVTGKLDVREAAARLPDEAAPDTAEDDTDQSLDPELAGEEAAV